MEKFKKNDKVTVNGEEGVVLRYYADHMIEVQLRSGMVCVDENDAKILQEARK